MMSVLSEEEAAGEEVGADAPAAVTAAGEEKKKLKMLKVGHREEEGAVAGRAGEGDRVDW
jgi:hypothetical protein